MSSETFHSIIHMQTENCLRLPSLHFIFKIKISGKHACTFAYNIGTSFSNHEFYGLYFLFFRIIFINEWKFLMLMQLNLLCFQGSPFCVFKSLP